MTPFVFALLITPAIAQVMPESDRTEVGAPTRISVGPGDFGQQPEATPQHRVLVLARAALLVDTPNLFGTIGADFQMRGSWHFAPYWWATFNLSAIEYRNVINASITASSLALGPL